MTRFSAVLAFGLLFAGRMLIACECARPVAAPCGQTLADVASGITFIGTVTSAENPGIAEKPQDYSTLSHYHFHIDELLRGTENLQTMELISTRGGADCSAHFSVGVQYLIYAYQQKDGTWSTSICAGNRVAGDAGLLISQLRALRRGDRAASLYGVLQRVQQPYGTVKNSRYDRVLGNVRIQLHDGDRMYETVTDQLGQYLFYNLPGGDYRISASLPFGLELAQMMLTGPPGPLKVPDHACMEHEITALPSTRITGHVIDPAGKPLGYAFVALYRSELYGKTGLIPTWQEFQDANKPFVFTHVAPGDYLLVFNDRGENSPDQPYPRTFYGDALEPGKARHIKISESDTVVMADIHVTGGSQTRQIKVNVVNNDGHPDASVFLNVKATSGTGPFPRKVAPGVYTVNLLKNARYTISAQDICIDTIRNGRRIASDELVVGGDDDNVTEVTLHLPRGACPPIN